VDAALKTGWGVRPYNWETTAGLQQQLWPGVAINAMYYRRWFGNFTTTDNLLVATGDFDPFCVTVPADGRLPGGGGNRICGLYDLNPGKVGQNSSVVTAQQAYGKQSEVYNGFDLTITARLPKAAYVQGGVNLARTEINNCFVVDSPQALLFCDSKPPFQPQFKFIATYPLPWDVQLSGTFQSTPGTEILANYAVTSAQVASSLGRNLSAGANSTVTVPLIAPGTTYGQRLYQIDARLTKSLKVGRAHIRGNVDLYNLLNASTVLLQNNTYGPAWQAPAYVLPGRLLKVSAQLNF
jgi:hypothetical protein